MSKKIRGQAICLLLSIVIILSSCSVIPNEQKVIVNNTVHTQKNDENSNKYVNKIELPDSLVKQISDIESNKETDKEPSNKCVDKEGNLLVPYDIAYNETFENGKVKYDENTILLKFNKSFKGIVTTDLCNIGVESLEYMMKIDDYVWYIANLKQSINAKEAITAARKLKEVVIADYNYIYENETIIQEDINFEEVLNNSQISEQWYLKTCGVQSAWELLKEDGKQAGGSPGVTVAVIDTGVDYNHPDLKANIWINIDEIQGNGIDDDNNGYIDDYYGYDFVSNDNDPMDDHGHGTHVAGIIGGVNNKEGIVGIAYNTKIMVIKAGQSSGYFTQSSIAQAILYAYENGADVINMSFGGSACSIAVQDALSIAYTRSVLVASAGNNSNPNEKTDFYLPNPNYPAALSYVIGVMSVNSNGVESSFTNWDVKAFNSIEYEVYAPGEQILSTLPNGKYTAWSGTSMAAPFVSSIAAILRSQYTDRDMYPTKFIYGQICSTSDKQAVCNNPDKHTVGGNVHNLPNIVDAYKALTVLPKPDINLSNYYIFDNTSISSNNNGDGVIDAGETLNLGLVLRNRWGMSKDTIVTIDAISPGGIPCPFVEFANNDINYDSVGTYSTKDLFTRNGNIITGVESPFVIKITEDCPNDYIIRINVTGTYKNGLDDNDSTEYFFKDVIEISVRSGVILPSQITEDMTLTSDHYYIIPNSTVIKEGVTVTVEPGTNIQFWTNDPTDPYADEYIAYLMVEGNFICKGTEENPVKLFPSELMASYRVQIYENGNGFVSLEYTDIVNGFLNIEHYIFNNYNAITSMKNCRLTQNYSGNLNYRVLYEGKVETRGYYAGGFYILNAENCVFYKLGGYNSNGTIYETKIAGNYKSCAFISSSMSYDDRNSSFDSCLFLDNNNNGAKSKFEKGNVFESVEVSKVVTNANTGVTYFQIKLSDLVYGYYFNQYNAYQRLSESLGGNIACFETEEEMNYIRGEFNSYNNLICGLIKTANNKYKWMNGVELAYDIQIGSDYNKDYRYNDLFFTFNPFDCKYYSSSGTDILIEFPASSGINTAEEFLSRYNEYVEKGYLTNFYGNAIINNYTSGSIDSWLRIHGSNSDTYTRVGLGGNYWGTTDVDMINRQIVDYDDYKTLIDINIGEYLTTPPTNVWPFVTDIRFYNQEGKEISVVGNEVLTIEVSFNRDMNTSIELDVRFGSSIPYAEYQVSGTYKDARTWVGTYKLNTTIENGNQYIFVANGCAADNSWLKLYPNSGRFTFEIDTTAAQAMLMQGSANEQGINLTWYQDDFDTLAGYNVYRSTSEDGFYIRVNTSIIPADTKEFFDKTVEPGVLYYYNFTVVKTDLTESEPSGKINLMSLDTMAPNIYHSPVYQAFTNNHLVISATIIDNVGIQKAELYYRITGEDTYIKTNMTAINDKYTGMIPSEHITIAGIEYYIVSTDGINNIYSGSADNPYVVTVQTAIDKNSLGDVNGDGAITTLDALMLLQAVNDRLNLTAEEFARADINGDEQLSAFEALRILQYVNGTVTSIMF